MVTLRLTGISLLRAGLLANQWCEGNISQHLSSAEILKSESGARGLRAFSLAYSRHLNDGYAVMPLVGIRVGGIGRLVFLPATQSNALLCACAAETRSIDVLANFVI